VVRGLVGGGLSYMRRCHDSGGPCSENHLLGPPPPPPPVKGRRSGGGGGPDMDCAP
jgi:hypothetical protein